MNRLQGTGLVLAGAAAGALGLYAVLSLGGHPAEPEDAAVAVPATAASSGLHLDAATLKQSGIALAPLAPAAAQGEVPGYARALDLSPLAAIAAEATVASAAADASAREAARLGALAKADAGAPLKELEASRAQAAADQARRTFACQRVALEFGAGLARLGCGALASLARDAAAGQLAVLRLDFPGAPVAAGMAVSVDLGQGAVIVRTLGPAAAGDSQLQTAGALALLRGPAAARAGVGRVMAARMASGGVRAGLLVPREAIVRADGGLYTWRALSTDTFERVPLEGAQAEAQGWIVPAGPLKAGDRVVVSGAGTLLGLEHAAPAAAAADD